MISLHLRGTKLMISIHLNGRKLYDLPPLRVQIYLGRFFKRSFLYGVNSYTKLKMRNPQLKSKLWDVHPGPSSIYNCK